MDKFADEIVGKGISPDGGRPMGVTKFYLRTTGVSARLAMNISRAACGTSQAANRGSGLIAAAFSIDFAYGPPAGSWTGENAGRRVTFLFSV